MEPLNLPTYLFRLKEDRGKKYIFDEIRRRFVLLTPEEWVRQHVINFLVQVKNFPRNLISIEKGFNQNRNRQRYDLLIYNNLGNPMMIVECKAPGVEINQQVFDQAGRYNNRHKANYMLITNGVKHYCCMINLQNRQYAFLNDVPDYSSMMAVIVQK
ncbi:MAG TPA: type I restriction enzyme HsdR N-terminal domain-containing protein [Bacteroidales bacterium]|nr:type I restriction enzyme HsdR N-terminal domain-containing protein [Bacteroidales bacterium]